MRKQWVALLSVLGLTGSGVRVQAQVLKGSATRSQAATKQKTVPPSKLNLNQQTLRQQNQGQAGRNYPPPTVTGGNNAVTKGSSNQAVTKGSPNKAITKGSTNNAVTKGGSNQAITKGSNLNLNQQTLRQQNTGGVKGNQAVTKGNQAVTKGNQAVTKGSQAVPR